MLKVRLEEYNIELLDSILMPHPSKLLLSKSRIQAKKKLRENGVVSHNHFV